ncbi:MAG: DnaA/Hda family protein [Candidatus Paracaedibacteraceae bacterium]|nr:DnaA/Hda family protein [Candidatus Paracaedibacteraceae bacterium]
MKQLAFSFPNIPTYNADSYVVSDCNVDAYRWLQAYPNWSGAIGSIILGDQLSGKTHLCHTFIEKHKSVRSLNGHVCSAHHPFDFKDSLFIIDDADQAPAPWLFHFFNHAKEKGAQFVLTMTHPHQDWCRLKDLSSRLATLPTFQLNLPDDAMMLALLKKNLADRGVFVDEPVLVYLGQHIDRSYAMADYWVQLLERLSAEQKRNITIAFIRGILNDMKDAPIGL